MLLVKLLFVFIVNFFISEAICQKAQRKSGQTTPTTATTVQTFSCFTETYGSYLLKLRDIIGYYEKLGGIIDKPDMEQTLKYFLYLDDFRSRLSLNQTFINEELKTLLSKSALDFSETTKGFVQNKTTELIEKFNVNFEKSKVYAINSYQSKSIFQENYEMIKNIKFYLKTKVIYHTQYPEFMTNNVRKILKYRKQIIHLTNMLTNSLATQTDCLPSDYDYMPIYVANDSKDYIPESNKVNCQPIITGSIKIDPVVVDYGGLAFSFWVYENIQNIDKANLKFVEVFNGLINNKISNSYRITKEIQSDVTVTTNTITINHILTFARETVTIRTTPKCAQYVFVLLAFQKESDKYRLIVSLRFPGSNTRQSFTIYLTTEEVENLVISFNSQNDYNLINRMEYHKNYIHSEYEELKIVFEKYRDNFYDYKTTQGNIHIPKDALAECKVNPICTYSVLKNPEECEVCEKGFVNFKKKCVDKCPDGTFMSKKENEDKFECLPCGYMCNKCTSLETCSECKTGLNLLLYGGECIYKCPENTVQHTVTIDINNSYQSCKVCDPNCLFCGNEQDGCLMCKGDYLDQEGRCEKVCSAGYYKEDMRRSCLKCDQKCILCEKNINTNQEQCNQCKVGYFLLNGNCHQSCPSGYLTNTTAKTCDKCIDNCLSCPVITTDCVTCDEGFDLIANVGENKKICHSKCPKGYVMSNSVCVPCTVTSCVDCLKTDTSICSKCDAPLVLKENKCEASCGDGYYLSSKTQKCEKCDSECEKCTDGNKCLNCKSPKLLFHDNSCIDVCPSGYVKFGSVCVMCQNIETCQQCSAINTQTCINCYPGQFLHEGLCLDICPDKLVGKDGKCLSCSTGCLKCDGLNSCKKCDAGLYLKNDVCVNQCGAGYVLNTSKNECIKCGDPQCEECYETNPNNCKKCVLGSFLNELKCVDKCPAASFANANSECENCKNGCVECTNKFDCKKCEVEKFVQNDNCVDRCDEGNSNILRTANECKKCYDLNCKLCDSDVNKCETCKSGFVLLEEQCVTSCPVGYFFDANFNKCTKCDPICAKCEASSNKCTSCHNGFTLSLDNTCIDPCPDFQVADMVDKTKCHSCSTKMTVTTYSLYEKSMELSCKKCSSLNLNECVSCPTGYKYNTVTKTCNIKCPYGFYESVNGDKCEKCVANCRKCENQTGICNQCQTGYFLFGNQCIKSCPEGFVGYENLYTSSATCVACEVDNCLTCDKNNLKNCFVCRKPFSLYLNFCVNNCPQGFYTNPINNNCISCTINNCDKCSNQDVNSCIKCKEGYLLLDNTCVHKCPSGYKDNKLTGTCEKCDLKDCVNCDNDRKSCTKCAEGLYYDSIENKCVNNCPLSTFPNTNTQKCIECSENCLICSTRNTCTKCDTESILFEGRCVNVCPSGYYSNIITNTCVKCDDTNCIKCYAKDKCEKCKAPKLLHNNACLDVCPDKTFLDATTQKCQECGLHCATCDTPDKCLKCELPKTLQANGECKDPCPDKFTAVNSTCVPCKTSDLNCKKCLSTDLTKCEECIVPKFLFNNLCVETCPEEFYLDNKVCKNCLPNCKSCQSLDECIICKTNYALHNKECVLECPSKFYKENGECKPCGNNCITCHDDKICTVCPVGLYIQGGKCEVVCESGFYKDETLKKCMPCSSNCNQCTNADTCTACATNFFIQDGKCVGNCNTGYVLIESQCTKCLTDCIKCNADQTKRCIECKSGTFLKDGACVSECPLAGGYFSNNSTMTCNNCEPNECIECTSATNCTKCKDNKLVSPTNSTLCIDTCPVGYTKSGATCISCKTLGCETCQESNADTCTKCISPKVLFNNTCIESCPIGTYLESGICKTCDTFCKACTGKGSCSECETPYNLTFVTSSNSHICLTPCGVGKTPDPVNGTCVDCQPSDCFLCAYQNTTDCKECKSPLHLTLINGIKECKDNCPTGTFTNIVTLNCDTCKTNCTECSSYTNCNVCKSGYLLSQGECVLRCPEGYVERNSKCVLCSDTNCKQCDNVNTETCFKCAANYYLKDDKCVTECGDGYFSTEINSIKYCKRCTTDCKVCDSATNCKECNSPKKLHNQVCVDTCPLNWVSDNNNICKECIDTNCNKCQPNNQANCIECKLPNVLHIDKCLINCPEGYYLSSTNQCVKCQDDNALTCIPAPMPNECKSPKVLSNQKCVDTCPEGSVNVNGKCEECSVEWCGECSATDLSKCNNCLRGFSSTVNNTSICTDVCPEGTIADIITKTCLRCTDTFCKKCSTNKDTCETCKDYYNLTLTNGVNKCIDPCPVGSISLQFTKPITNEIYTQCVTCNTTNIANCTKCSNLNSTECTECATGTYLYNNLCVNVCPSGTFLKDNKCEICGEKCSQCNTSYFNCTECKIPYILDTATNTCVETCLDGYVKVNNICTKCTADPTTCKTCAADSLNTCVICKPGFKFYNGGCVSLCPSGTVYDSTTNRCNPCTTNCNICSYNNLNTITCNDCENGFFIHDGACVSTCPTGYYKDYNTCKKCTTSDCQKCVLNGSSCTECNLPKFLYNNNCVDNCPPDTINVNNTCALCTTSCKTCKSASECLECNLPLEILPDAKCGYKQCQPGFILRDGVCIACNDENCRICNPTNLNQCNDCKSGFFILNDQCVTTCPSGYYYDAALKTCQVCSLNCKTCLSAAKCDECLPNFFKLDDQCVTCSDKKYVTVGTDCKSCNVTMCDQCQPNLIDKCKDCRPDKSLTPAPEYICSDACPTGTFRNEITQKCENCNTNCTTCSTSATCDTCKDPLINHNGACIDSCPSGYVKYVDPLTNSAKCRKCRDDHCLVCDSIRPEVCQLCDATTFLFSEQCKSICPSGFYMNNKTCINCPSGCENCEMVNSLIPTELNSKLVCKKCDIHHKLQNGVCVKECSIGYFETPESNCILCQDTNCIQCNPSETCRKCTPPTFLDKTLHTCVSYCKDGTFKNVLTNECDQCKENCKLCKDASTCFMCQEGFKSFNNTCLKTCPNGFTDVNGVCIPCSQGECMRCEQNRPDICVECNSTSYLVNGNCVTGCPTGTYANTTTHKCENCDIPCLTCDNSTHCITCKNEFYLKDGNCINKCEDGKVEKDGKCTCCNDHNCKTCMHDLKSCLDCLDGFFLYDNSCVKVCPLGYFKNDKRQCVKCSENCEICMNAETCSKCYSKTFLTLAKTCVKECEMGLYGDCITGVCAQCHESCERCIDNTNSNCPLCSTGFFKSDANCVTKANCKYGTYGDDETRECVSCRIPNCDLCNDRNTCRTCLKGYTLSTDNSTCSEFKSIVNILKPAVIFSEPSHEKFNFFNGYSFSKQLKSQCVESNFFTISFWMRLLTPDFTSNPIILDIKDNSTIIDSTFSNFGSSITFKIQQIENDRLKCIAILKHGSSAATEASYDDCTFLKLQKWNFFAININKDKEINSYGLGSNVNLVVYETASNQTYYIKKNFTETVYNKSSVIISNNTNLYINPNYATSPYFELANMNIMEYIPQIKDIDMLSNKDKPTDCDYNCIECSNNKCLKCNNANTPNSDGYCPASFVSVNVGLRHLDRISYTTEVRTILNMRYLSSDRYSFASFIYLDTFNNPNNENKTTLRLVSMEYKQNIILRAELANNKLTVKIGDLPPVVFNNNLLLTKRWYAFGISVSPQMVSIMIYDMTLKQVVIRDEKVVHIDRYVFRLLPDALLITGEKVTDISGTYSTLTTYDTRIYVNNMISSEQQMNYVLGFRCTDNCAECDNNLNCMSCIAGFEVNAMSNTCELKSIGKPSSVYLRKSIYNYESDLISAPFNFINTNFTVSIWMRKNLPSAYGVQSNQPNTPLTNLISFVDSSNGNLIPFAQQLIAADLTSIYTFDNAKLITQPASARKSQVNEDNNYFTDYLKRVESQVDKQTPTTTVQNQKVEYPVSYRNITADFIHVVLTSENDSTKRKFTVYINDRTINKSSEFSFDVHPQLKLDNKIILGDQSAAQVNMAFGPNALYLGEPFNKEKVTQLNSVPPKDCDPSCIDCNHWTGYCRLCAMDKLQGEKCNLFFYGFKKTSIYNNDQYLTVKRQALSTGYHEDYNVAFNNIFKNNKESSNYSVIGWFQLFSLIKAPNSENILFRLSNMDNPQIKEDDPFYVYYPGVNLITMKVTQNAESIASYSLVVSDADKDQVFKVEGLSVTPDEWVLFYAYKNLKERLVGYEMYAPKSDKYVSQNFTLSNYPQKLQEVGTLKFFGINSVTSSKTLPTYGYFFNVFSSSNQGYNANAFEKYRTLYDPTILDDKCDTNCSKCLVDNCFTCNAGYILSNNICTSEKLLVNYLLLTDQNTVQNQLNKVYFPPNVITDTYGFQFDIRRNYQNLKSVVSDLKSRVFLELGSLKFALITSNTDAFIKIYSSTDSNYFISVGPLDGNSAIDYNWHTVLLNFDGIANTVVCTLINKENTIIDKKTITYNHVKTSYDNVIINNLNYEVTTYGNVFILNYNKMTSPLLNLPEIDCPIDCTSCEKNNQCKTCTYGNECDLNDPNSNACKIRWKSIYTMELSNSQPNKNIIAFKDLFPSNKLIRFKQFSLIFSFSLKEYRKYNNILRVINNPDTGLNNFDPTSINYNVLSMSYNSETKKFSITYHNRQTELKFQTPLTTVLRSFPSSIFKNEIHYIGISYNSNQKKFVIVLYNTQDNYVIDEIPIVGELENLGLYTNLVFFEDYLKLNSNVPNASVSIGNLKLVWENSSTSEQILKKITSSFKTDFAVACDKTDPVNSLCLKCQGSNILLNGICLSENLATTPNSNPFVFYPNSPIASFTLGDNTPLIMTGFNQDVNSFTLQFYYRRLSYPESNLNAILSLSLFDANNKAEGNLYELYEVDSHLVGIAKVFGTEPLISFVEDYVDSSAKFAWVYVTIEVDIAKQTNSINVWNSLSQRTYFKKMTVQNVVSTAPIKIPTGYSLGINYDLSKIKVTIPSEILSRSPTYEQTPSPNSEFNIANLIFTPNYLYTDEETSTLRPNKPIKCACACGCVNSICPESCRLDNVYADLSNNLNTNGDLFNKIANTVQTSLLLNNNMIFNSNMNSVENQKATAIAADFHKFAISFTLNTKNYLGYLNNNSGTSMRKEGKDAKRKTFISRDRHAQRHTMQFATGQEDLTNSGAGEINWATTASSTDTMAQPVVQTSTNLNVNKDILFMITNQFETAGVMKTSQQISEQLILQSMLTLRVVNNKIRAYIGSNRFTNYLSYTDIDLNISEVDRIVLLVYLDIHDNLSKFIMFADNKRIEHSFNYNFAAENINIKTLFYYNSMIEHPIINVSDNLEGNLFYLKSTIESNKYKENFCPANCKTCLNNKCMECNYTKRMHNNACINVSNSSDFAHLTKKKRNISDRNNEVKNQANNFIKAKVIKFS